MNNVKTAAADISAKNGRFAMALYYAGAAVALVAVITLLLFKSSAVALYMLIALAVVIGLGFAGNFFANKCVSARNGGACR